MAEPVTTKRRPGANEMVSPPDDAQNYTMGEVAFLLRSSVATVRRLVGRGELRVVHAAGRRLVSRDAYRDYVRKVEWASRPADERTAAEKAAAKEREAKIMGSMVKADWNTGPCLLPEPGQGGGRRGRPRKDGT